MNLTEWAKKIYDEEDFGRSISITVSGVIGLAIYLRWKDWFLSLVIAVIIFPMLRLIASAAHARWKESRKHRVQSEEFRRRFQNLSPEEKKVVKAFVDAGGAAMTWSQVNRANLPVSAIESLVLRSVISTSVTADGMTETFIMQPEVFDAAQQAFSSSSPLRTDEVPF